MQLSREQLEQAYRRMKTIREFEERLHLEIGKGEIPGFTHLYSGQEACAVGVCENLTNDDQITSTHRGHGHCIAKGCDVKAMMKEIYGKAGGLCGGKGGSMHIADVDVGMMGANGIVGGGPPLAVGAAIAARNRGKGEVGVSFGGDGSSNQGPVFEAMNLAVVRAQGAGDLCVREQWLWRAYAVDLRGWQQWRHRYTGRGLWYEDDQGRRLGLLCRL